MGDDSVRSLRRAGMFTLATLLLLPTIASAQSPWERAANNLALTFTGPLARALGHPDRDAREIEEWALEHHLPYFDEQVHFPDLRIEYAELDGRSRHEDVEVLTVHYRGAHGAAAARSGFTAYRGFSARIGGRSGRGGRGGRNGGLAEELLG